MNHKSVSVDDVAAMPMFQFIKTRLTQLAVPRHKLLLVGSGRGALAAALSRDGFDVTAVERSTKHASMTKGRGIRVIKKDFLRLESSGGYDAIVFARSLHHIHRLRAAVAKAHQLLCGGGLVFLDEFSVGAMDLRTAKWFYKMSELIAAITGRPDGMSVRRRAPVSRWKTEHAHSPSLHRKQGMIGAVKQRFLILHQENAAYLHRYWTSSIAELPSGGRTLDILRAIEAELIEDGAIRAVGFRLCGQKRS